MLPSSNRVTSPSKWQCPGKRISRIALKTESLRGGPRNVPTMFARKRAALKFLGLGGFVNNMQDMVQKWHRLGFIVKKGAKYVETGRRP